MICNLHGAQQVGWTGIKNSRFFFTKFLLNICEEGLDFDLALADCLCRCCLSCWPGWRHRHDFHQSELSGFKCRLPVSKFKLDALQANVQGMRRGCRHLHKQFWISSWQIGCPGWHSSEMGIMQFCKFQCNVLYKYVINRWPIALLKQINRDQCIHNVCTTDGNFVSPDLEYGEVCTKRMDSKKPFRYYCSMYPHMMGEIRVQHPEPGKVTKWIRWKASF